MKQEERKVVGIIEQPPRPVEGIKKIVIDKIVSGNVDDAINLFEDHSLQVEEALKEYNTKSHSIMARLDKVRKDKSDYRTWKLPRNWQQYINEIELYFLLANGIKWEMLNDDQESNEALQKAFDKFKKLLKKLHYDSRTREFKRLAGAETECAKLYAYYKDEDKAKLRIVILARSKGYKLRPLFNMYGDLKAFAVGYDVKDGDGNLLHRWDVYTSEMYYHCTQNEVGSDTPGWTVTTEVNPFGKIPIIYARQKKAWAGAEERIERDEWLDSKNADCNEYFADPMLKMSKSVKNGLMGAKEVGKVIQVGNKDDVFEYVTPPDASDMKEKEKSLLKESILNSTMTPDLSYENVKGLGAISGEAITKANIIAYIKRLNNMEIYDELFERDASLLIEIMATVLYPADRKIFRAMELNHNYQDPAIGQSDNSEEIARWADIGMSDEAIVEANRNVSNKQLELKRLRKKREDEARIAASKNNTVTK